MKIALLGYGKMGKEIETLALSRRHDIVLTIDAYNLDELTPGNLSRADVAIDFSTPESAYSNILKCFEANVPVVCGTTGWLGRFDEVKKACADLDQTFFYASNFSLGMNLFFMLNKYLGRLMDPLPDYEISIRETHHVHKLDAPSGTAISLANDLIALVDRKKKWELNQAGDPGTLNITAVREGEVPGTHTVTCESEVDLIEITHLAKSRRGLALGAVLAAEFVHGKKGAFSMQDMMKEIMNLDYEL
jgi:4-hydroxy-tetrahydrodipicolinate reductase